METLGLITMYSIMMLLGLSAVSAAFVFVGVWLSDESEEEEDAAH